MDGINLPKVDLNSLQAGEELAPANPIELGYSKNSYPKLDTMLKFIEENGKKKPKKIDLDKLSINGECVQDEMQTYLDTKAISSGNLKEAAASPLAFFVDYVNQFEERDLKNKCFLEFGSIIHTAILQPELFNLVAIKPEGIKLSENSGLRRMIRFYNDLSEFKTDLNNLGDLKQDELRRLHEKLKNECKHIIVSETERIVIETLKNNYFAYGRGILPKIMNGAIAEVSMYCKEPKHGLEAKIRPDAINIQENIGVNLIISVKTTSKKNLSSFIHQTGSLKYEISEGYYQDIASYVTGRKFNATLMIMLQTVAPFQVAAFWWTPDSIEVGKYKANLSLSLISECFENGVFPGLDVKAPVGNCGIYELELPAFSFLEELPSSLEN